MTTQSFIATKEHRRFAEFADAVRRQHTIGICLRPGRHRKDPLRQALRQLAQGREPGSEQWGPRDDSDYQIYAALARARTVFYTPAVLTSPKQIHAELEHISTRVSICVDQHLEKIGKKTGPHTRTGKHVELLIIDESERLNATSLELLRDRYDRDNIALILIGMPGIEKWLSRYAQLYGGVDSRPRIPPTRTGRTEFRPGTPMAQTRPNPRPGRLHRCPGHRRRCPGSPEATSASSTGSSPKSSSIMRINELSTITDDVIEAARSTLVIGIS